MSKAQEYCVIIGDIEKSKEMTTKERALLQTKFRAVMTRINKDFAPEIVSRFLITLGDEFQGMLRSQTKSYDFILKIEEALYPTRLTFGVGVGIISTEIRREAIGMDGAAFYKARQALERAKVGDQHIIYMTGHKNKDSSINIVLLLLDIIRSGWTPRQYEIVRLYRSKKTHEEVAKSLQVKRSVVTRSLLSAHWRAVDKAEKFLREQLSQPR